MSDRPSIRERVQASVRERVRTISTQLVSGANTPQTARDALMQLTGLLSHIADARRDADLAYKRVLLAAYGTEKTRNRAELQAETTEEYQFLEEVKDTERIAVESIRSCKEYLRSLDSEMRLSR